MWLVSDTLGCNVVSSDIGPGIYSDHSVVTLQLKPMNESKFGKSYWKFNNSLLDDVKYVEQLNNLLTLPDHELDSIEDKRLAWEMVKMKVRRFTISYSIEKSKCLNKQYKEVKERLV